MNCTRQDIVAYARTMLRTPYHHQGRLPGVGLDCIGLVEVCMRRFEIPHVDVTDYPEYPDGVSMLREFRKYLTEVSGAPLQPGQVLCFAFPRPALVRHCGIYTGNNAFIHTYRAVHKVVEHALDGAWRARLVNVFDFPGVTN